MTDLMAMIERVGSTPPLVVKRALLAFCGLALGCLAPLMVAGAKAPQPVQIVHITDDRPGRGLRGVSRIDLPPSPVAPQVVQNAAHKAFEEYVMARSIALSVSQADPFEQLTKVGLDGHGLRTTLETLNVDFAAVEGFDLSRIDVSAISSNDRRCLSQAIYYEARSQSLAGQMAVADVVLNRVAHERYPDTICGVVYQGHTRDTGCQFSFTCDGSTDARVDRKAMYRSQLLATAVLGGFRVSLSQDATNYHATYVDPYWAPTLDRTVKIDDHVFYKRGPKFHRAVAKGVI